MSEPESVDVPYWRVILLAIQNEWWMRRRRRTCRADRYITVDGQEVARQP